VLPPVGEALPPYSPLGFKVPCRTHGPQASPGSDPALWALKGVVLKGVVLKGVVLKGVVLKGVVLKGVVLKGVVLKGVVLKGVVLKGVALQRPLRRPCGPVAVAL
jgi:uncharacterized protein YjbI with pentapeptide repeats